MMPSQSLLPRPGPVIYLRSAIYAIVFYLWMLVCALLMLPLMLAPRAWLWWAVRTWMAGIVLLLRWICRIRHRVVGQENLPDGPAIFAADHQAAWETFVLTSLRSNLTFVLKRELMHVPFFGWYARRTGMIPVDRAAGPRALRSMAKAARSALARGRSIAVFPGGTRRDVFSAARLQPGIAALYHQLNVPVVPIALNSGLYWRNQSFLKFPGCITVEILPSIPPGKPQREMLGQLERSITDTSHKLVAQELAKKR
ncbi:MAG: lysophospholipid acyltransferase family protein [Geminicoccaceae bacterium]